MANEAQTAISAPAEVVRILPRVPKGGVPGPLPTAPVVQTTPHTAISLAKIVLNSTFADGAHLAYSEGTFRHFDLTNWATLSEADLGRVILDYIGHEGARRQRTPALIRDVIATLRHATAGTAPAETADARPIINVRNGELWIGTDGAVTLRPHDPASGQRHCSDVIYKPDATCPRYDRALADICSASSDPAALVALWHELVGYLLQPIRRRPLILVAAGQGRDGKSALAETLVRLLGRAQVTAMPVENLTGSRFVLGDLAESRVFVDPDMTAGVLLPDGVLKKLSEGTTVTAERKFLDPVTFTMRAVPLLLTNNTPRLADHSPGFRRRLLVLPFERQFTEAEVDYGLFPTIHETELSGVLNRALEGLQTVVQRGWKVDLPQAVARATEAWWAEATGGLVGGSKHGRMEATQKLSVRSPTPTVATKQHLARGTQPQAADPSLGLNVSIELPEASKGCTVNVRVAAAAVEVRVTGAPEGRPRMRLEPKNGR